MRSDFIKTPEATRKPLTYKDPVLKHQCCGAYLHFMSQLQTRCPEKEWDGLHTEMREAFFNEFLDPDLLNALTTSVPPGDLLSIGAFRCIIKTCCYEIST